MPRSKRMTSVRRSPAKMRPHPPAHRPPRRRSLLVGASLAALIAGGTTAGVLLSGGHSHVLTKQHTLPSLISIPPPPSTAPSPVPPRGGTLPRTLLYVQRNPNTTDVRQLDLTSGRSLIVTRVQTAGAFLAPEGQPYVAYVMKKLPSGREVSTDRKAKGTDVVHLKNLHTGKDLELGPGDGIKWSGDGRRLAVVRPAGSLSRVWATSVQSKHFRPVSPPSKWTIEGWAGRRILLFNTFSQRFYTTTLVGSFQRAPSPDALVKSVSPDGRWEFGVTHQGDAVFVPMDG